MLGKKGAAASVENSAMIASDANANKVFTSNQQRQNEKPQVWNDYCNKPHHTQENCWKIHGKPAN